MHGVPIDPALLIGVREDEAVIADHVDEPRDPARIFGDPVHRWICEQTQVARAGDTKPSPDILTDFVQRSEEHTSELQSQSNLVCRLLLEKKKRTILLH